MKEIKNLFMNVDLDNWITLLYCNDQIESIHKD